LKLLSAIQVYGGLAELANKDIPPAFGFRVGMMLSKLEPVSANYDREAAKLRHKYGIDQAPATLNGVVTGEGAPALREIDQGAFQEDYQMLMESDAGTEPDILMLKEILELKSSDGKPIPGLGTIAAKLAPILKE
jgi:hypothetical protein